MALEFVVYFFPSTEIPIHLYLIPPSFSKGEVPDRAEGDLRDILFVTIYTIIYVMITVMTYLDQLNPEQREAATTTEGPLLIIAGAGAGKTKTITHRIFHLMKNDVPPVKILAITFTNKAAKEMRQRVVKMMWEDEKLSVCAKSGITPMLCTYHALGVRILRENAERLNIPRHFVIFDRSDARAALKKAVKAAEYDPKDYPPQKAGALISREKNRGINFEEYAESVEEDTPVRVFVRDVWREYERILQESKSLDFDDLLLKTYRLLRDDAEVREHYQTRWNYLHIDEYQDTNRIQYLITKLLSEKHRNICAVADADQTIYSWRGSEIANVLRFEKDFAGAEIVRLEQNYRSTKTILAAANRVIEKNQHRIPKELFTQNDEGELLELNSAYTENDEARTIAERIKELGEKGVHLSEIAILFRANFQSRVLEEAMLRKNIPYQLVGTKFFERREVKDVLAFIRAAVGYNPNDTRFVSIRGDVERIINVPSRGIGKVTMEKIFTGNEGSLPQKTAQKISDFRDLLIKLRKIAETDTPDALIKAVIKKSGMEDAFKADGEEGLERLENVRELVTLAQKYKIRDDTEQAPNHMEAVEQLLEDAALASDQDEVESETDRVKLLTVHASKGLEFDHIFITGLENGLFPHQKINEENISEEEAEEERRLFYVALTRARKKVCLSHAAVRTIYGSQQANAPSEFINDVGEELLEIQESKVPHTGLLDEDSILF